MLKTYCHDSPDCTGPSLEDWPLVVALVADSE